MEGHRPTGSIAAFTPMDGMITRVGTTRTVAGAGDADCFAAGGVTDEAARHGEAQGDGGRWEATEACETTEPAERP